MIGNRLDISVDVGIEVLAALTLVDAARHNMPEVRDDACAHHELSFGVVVDAPRIAEPVRDDFKAIFCRMVAPDAAVDLDALTAQEVVGECLTRLVKTSCPDRLSDLGRSGKSLESIQP